MSKKMLSLALMLFLVTNITIETSYSLKLIGYDPSDRDSPTYIHLNNHHLICLDLGEEITIHGKEAGVLVNRSESGWHETPIKTKPSIRLVWKKSGAYKPEPFFLCLAVSRRTKVLLFSPELKERTYPGRPPIYYLSSVLRQNGHEVLTIDVDIAGRKKFLRQLREFQPDIVGGTSMSIQINEAMFLMELVRKELPKVLTVLGGNHATAAGQYLFPIHKDYLDVVVVGEGLTVLRLIAEAIANNTWEAARSEISGLLQWDGTKTVFNGPGPAEDPNDFQPDLPYDPAYDFAVFQKADGTKRRTFHLMTAFGCNNACFFCFNATNLRGGKRRVERRMDPAVVEQMLQRAVAAGYEAVYFDDDTFTRVRQYALDIAKLCKRYGLVFGCHTRPDCEDRVQIQEFARNGCVYMFSGLESAVPEILLAANKTHDPQRYMQAYLDSYQQKKDLGIPASAFMIHGMPRRNATGGHEADTLKDSLFSIEFVARQLDPGYLSMNALRFLPGTPFAFAPQFEFLRPNQGVLHGGYWDKKWLQANGQADLRCHHPILRAFDGSGSVVPVHMTPEHCYQVLAMAVEMVNKKNSEPGKNQTKIVVDPWFEQRFLHSVWTGNVLNYELAPFRDIDAQA